jgi:hypothetical protein
MMTADITAGPGKDELISLMLSNQPVMFTTSTGRIETLIEELEEVEVGGDTFVVSGHVIAGGRRGARIKGRYDCSTKAGALTISINGS